MAPSIRYLKRRRVNMNHRRVEYSFMAFACGDQKTWFTYVKNHLSNNGYQVVFSGDGKMVAETEEELKALIDEQIEQSGPIDLWTQSPVIRSYFKHLKINLDGYFMVNKLDKGTIANLKYYEIQYILVDDTKLNDILF